MRRGRSRSLLPWEAQGIEAAAAPTADGGKFTGRSGGTGEAAMKGAVFPNRNRGFIPDRHPIGGRAHRSKPQIRCDR